MRVVDRTVHKTQRENKEANESNSPSVLRDNGHIFQARITGSFIFDTFLHQIRVQIKSKQGNEEADRHNGFGRIFVNIYTRMGEKKQLDDVGFLHLLGTGVTIYFGCGRKPSISHANSKHDNTECLDYVKVYTPC
mmetsp:Transcript_10003/g.11537  ORF Transcript_10003/g.11537 Transcript_10003/m.11537 type:complete len:135 (-) Transcript_10003:163-567(-)